MAADVFFLPLDSADAAGEIPVMPAPQAFTDLVRRAGRGLAARDTWAVKLELGPPGRRAAVTPDWAAAMAAGLPGPAAFCCDTLSITTAGLATSAEQLDLARVKGFGEGGPAPAYVVADDPDAAPSPVVAMAGGDEPAEVTLAARTATAGGLAVLTPVRPHPHAGFCGAVTSLGLGLVDRAAKLILHGDIRPRVDTPLCAGCGSCLQVCIFDAIAIRGGRAWIDHERCTGCGECMNVCFMAGIAPEDAAGIPRFQAKVARAAAAAWAGPGGVRRPAVFVNLLVRLDRGSSGPARRRQRLGDIGVLAGRDPVAVDRAAWDLIAGRMGGSLQAWSGFHQEPGPLLDEAAAQGLGSTSYRLVTVPHGPSG